MKNGQTITKLRTEHKLTQTELAEKLFVSQQLISQWENGTRRPDRTVLRNMSEIFGCSVENILPPDKNMLSELKECIPDNKFISPEEAEKHINRFLYTLSEKERVIFLKRYYFMLSSKETAEQTGIKDNQVRTVLSRVRKKLKKYLSEVVL